MLPNVDYNYEIIIIKIIMKLYIKNRKENFSLYILPTDLNCKEQHWELSENLISNCIFKVFRDLRATLGDQNFVKVVLTFAQTILVLMKILQNSIFSQIIILSASLAEPDANFCSPCMVFQLIIKILYRAGWRKYSLFKLNFLARLQKWIW